MSPKKSGPLNGIRVLEMNGLGPCPFAGMILSDLGADVVRVDRPQDGSVPLGLPVDRDVVARGKRSIVVDLKHPQGAETLLSLCRTADILIEGFRPGVMERLGIGPEPALAANPALVYGRVTGWGQTGPLSARAGHDINYISISGALHAIGPRDAPPTVPLNLIADYAGGSLFLIVGVLAALREAQRSGQGQVVDAAMVDGSALLTSVFHGLLATQAWTDERQANLLDGGCFFYRAYQTQDGKSISLGPLEGKFFQEFLEVAGLPSSEMNQYDRARWPEFEARLEALFKTKTRAQWATLFERTDACVAPVLSLQEAPQHPHNLARGVFQSAFGITQPSPAPRFDKTPTRIDPPATVIGEHTSQVLSDWGLDDAAIARLMAAQAVR